MSSISTLLTAACLFSLCGKIVLGVDGGSNQTNPASETPAVGVPNSATTNVANAPADVRTDILTLEQSDPELFKVVDAMRNAWDANADLNQKTAREELNTKYIALLQKALPPSPDDREVFLTEISRLVNSQRLEVLDTLAPVELKKLRAAFDIQQDAVTNRVDAARKAARQEQQKTLAQLAAKRLAESNKTGAARVQAFAAFFNEGSTPPTLEAIIKNIIACDNRGLTNPAMGQAVANPGVPGPGANLVNSSLVAPPMTGVPFLRRPTKSGKVIAWIPPSFRPETLPSTYHVPEIPDAVAIAVTDSYGLALSANGIVTSWGTMVREPLLVPEGLDHVVQIVASLGYAAALREDGSIVEWTNRGILLPEDLTPAVELFCNKIGMDGYAKHTDGSLHRIGIKHFDWTRPPAGLKDVVEMAMHFQLAVALKKNGQMVGWHTSSQNLHTGLWPLPSVGSHLVKHVALADSNGVIILDDDTAATWGDPPLSPYLNEQKLPDVESIKSGGVGFIVKLKNKRWQNYPDSGPSYLVKPEELPGGMIDIQRSVGLYIGIKP